MSNSLLSSGVVVPARVSPSAQRSRLRALCESPWTLVLVCGLAVCLRAVRLTEWSMWEDEEGTVYFSQHTQMPFARAFPIYFVALKAVYSLTGVSVAAGRAFSAGIALLGLALVYACFRSFITRPAALLSLLLLAINVGHLFWSQSIRYYNLVVLFQLLAMYWFLVGFERRKYTALLLANGAFALAMLTHFSAILLVPALVAYLIVMALRRESTGAYNLKGYLIFGIPLAVILALFAARLVQMQGMLGGFTIPSARNPIHVLLTVVAYFGLPLIGLSLLSPLLAPATVSRRILLFFLAVSFIPVLELVVIACLNIINVTWYYALFALTGFAVLSSFSLLGLAERGRWGLAVPAGALAVVYYAAILVGYYTSMYGDRPRWEEAAHYLGTQTSIRPDKHDNPEVYATVPEVVQFYLTGPRQDGSAFRVRHLPSQPAEGGTTVDQWYVIEAGHASKDYEEWLIRNCTESARFESRTGPRDRTVVVYFHPARQVSR
jgi:Dolichyl-phosphate-mannose-protein mannosyltransferase